FGSRPLFSSNPEGQSPHPARLFCLLFWQDKKVGRRPAGVVKLPLTLTLSSCSCSCSCSCRLHRNRHRRSEHGIPGLLNLFGIESPALTASLAIGEYVGKRVAASAH
ncbi:hypothetical protein RA280_34560, partial [Cupriavidus sp. CV2]|nr:hypothetical protein [Cupriavidus sp. CV2]